MDEAKAEVLAFTGFPEGPLAQDLVDQPARARQQGDQAPLPRGRHLPELCRRHPPRRRSAPSTCTTNGSPATAATSQKSPWRLLSDTVNTGGQRRHRERRVGHRGPPQSPPSRGALSFLDVVRGDREWCGAPPAQRTGPFPAATPTAQIELERFESRSGRIMRMLIVGVAVCLAWLALGVPIAIAATDGCAASGGLTGVAVGCLKSGGETHSFIAGHSDHTYSIRPACEVGGTALCDAPAQCNVDGHDGWLFNVYQADDPDPLDWQAWPDQAGGPPDRRADAGGDVQREFERLSWPSSTVVVQPPKGRTLGSTSRRTSTPPTPPPRPGR